MQIINDEFEIFLFVNHMILYTKDSKCSTRKLLYLRNLFSKVAEYKIQPYYVLTTNIQRKKSSK